jgi:hemerythrin-like metal-binding protein
MGTHFLSHTRARFAHYMTGIPEIDESHWDIIEALNQLDDCIASNPNNPRLCRPVYDSVFRTMTKHWAEEEQWFAITDYPHAAPHIRSHRIELAKLEQRFEDFSAQLAKHRLNDCVHSFLSHIDHFDMPFVQWVIGAGKLHLITQNPTERSLISQTV